METDEKPDLELTGLDELVPRCETVRARFIDLGGLSLRAGWEDCGNRARWIGRFICEHGDPQTQLTCDDCHDWLVANPPEQPITWEAL